MAVIADTFYDDFCFLCDVYGKIIQNRAEIMGWRSTFAAKWMCEIGNISNRYKADIMNKVKNASGRVENTVEGDIVAAMITQYEGDEEFNFSFMNDLMELIRKRERHIEMSALHVQTSWSVDVTSISYPKYIDDCGQIDMYTFPSTCKSLPFPLHNEFSPMERGGKKRHIRNGIFLKFMREVCGVNSGER